MFKGKARVVNSKKMENRTWVFSENTSSAVKQKATKPTITEVINRCPANKQ
jgi:hypothetical protein